jgi:prepilin-type N-terminal cleavage/methylation domain-containing protein
MNSKQSGFTLIEIAIVLVIIGLLLGGVLKGQELINSAKVKNLATDFKNIPVYVYGYQDKFKALPGDDANVAMHVTGGTTCMGAPAIVAGQCNVGNGVIDGNWNDMTAASESYVFWQHVRLAGLASGSTNTTIPAAYLPTNAVGGYIGISNIAQSPIATLRGAYIICSDAIAGKFAKQLDITLDDGNTATGSLQIISAGSTAIGGTATANSTVNDDTPYLVCMGF